MNGSSKEHNLSEQKGAIKVLIILLQGVSTSLTMLKNLYGIEVKDAQFHVATIIQNLDLELRK